MSFPPGALGPSPAPLSVRRKDADSAGWRQPAAVHTGRSEPILRARGRLTAGALTACPGLCYSSPGGLYVPQIFPGGYSPVPPKKSLGFCNHFKRSVFLRSEQKEKQRCGLQPSQHRAGCWAVPPGQWLPTVCWGGIWRPGFWGGRVTCAPTGQLGSLPRPSHAAFPGTAARPAVPSGAQAHGTADCQAWAWYHTRVSVARAASLLCPDLITP